MKLFTHRARIQMEKDMESAHIEVERVRLTYRMLLEAAMLETKMEELRRLLQDDPAILDRVRSECRGMDNPLHVGALYGNVDFVREILKKQPELSRELNSEGQTPLHLASARGHAEVVKEILNRKRELTRELNSEGQSPLHLASERGHVEVVKEILSKDVDACFIRDRDGMIPLHLAAIQGRLEVVEVLVKAEKITTFILTKSGETILHLCANNNQFKALEKLIELVKDNPRFVNLRDRDDNTILHLLSAKENYQVIKNLGKIDGVDVNAKNRDGFTPLDVSLRSGSIVSTLRIHQSLTEAGAKGNVSKSLFALLKHKIEMQVNVSNEFAQALMVVAILMATVAFQARLNPPGGVWQDSGCHNATVPKAPKSSPTSPNALQCYQPNATVPNATMLHYHSAGQSIMSYMDSSSYDQFSISNDYVLAFSLLAMESLLLGYIFKSRPINLLAIPLTFLSFIFMSWTYFASVTFISLDKQYLLSGFLIVVSSTTWLSVSLGGLLAALLALRTLCSKVPWTRGTIVINWFKSWKTLFL